MKIPPEDWFWLLGLGIVTVLIIWGYDAGTVAELIMGHNLVHKGLSVVDRKIRDRIDDDPPDGPLVDSPPDV